MPELALAKFAGAALMSAEQLHELSFVLFFCGMAVRGAIFAWTEREV